MERQQETQAAAGQRRFIKDRIPRGLWVRVILYGLAGHLFAAFLLLLFQLGE
ncbi:DUF6126 family protein [Streptomyces sp. MS19]|uniref:DUF6126 family protein n=1 Tax=Streptomyces sp. MS19 TaxID=3385972 RepID=UPI0039A1D9EB